MTDKPVSTNITWHDGHLLREDRIAHLKQQGAVVWFTGLSGSGKSTVARQVELELVGQGHNAYVLDGDNIRHGLNKDLGFSPEDRTENIRRIGEVAHLLEDANVIALTAFISPYRDDRQIARALVPDGHFFEVLVDAPLAVCESRDPKGLYQKARDGIIPNFTGISAPYEAPDAPELVLRTDQEDVHASAQRVIAVLRERGILP